VVLAAALPSDRFDGGFAGEAGDVAEQLGVVEAGAD
jgi:hypothetical protein